jgi:hypothetical protein
MTLLLLSGCPGVGKTEMGNWLVEHRGFIHVETDAEWGTWGPLVCSSQSPEAAAETRERARALGPNVVIEWGFKVGLLGCVRQLQDAGFDAWWLDGDEEAARQGYMKRRGNSPAVMAAYWAQTRDIQAARLELESFYGDHIIRTVASGPTYLPYAEIASIMLPHAEK